VSSRIAASTSSRFVEVSNYLAEKVFEAATDKLHTLQMDLKTWMKQPKAVYFIPEPEVVLAIAILQQLGNVTERSNSQVPTLI